MRHRQASFYLGGCIILPVLIGALSALALGDTGGTAWADLSLAQGYRMNDMRTRERRLQDDAEITHLKGVPPRFTIRPMIDSSLCVNRVQLTAPSIIRARERSGLPPTGAEELDEYGPNRLILMPCSGARTETFLADAALGRSYRNSDVAYRIGYLKNPSDLSQCLYGVNHTYTDGHAVFGVTGTEYYSVKGGDTAAKKAYDEDDDDEMDWYDDYTFSYAPYVRYGYDPATLVSNNTFKSPNPLPITMLDATSWGPFHTSWGPCMKNPTVDSATPTDTTASEVELRYQTFIFLNVQGTPSISHLPGSTRKIAFALGALGPDRPQPDMSPMAGTEDAGMLSNDMGGSDKPYGTGYASLVSNELCMTASVIKEGAEVRLARCNPVSPSLEQVFQLVSVVKAKKALR